MPTTIYDFELTVTLNGTGKNPYTYRGLIVTDNQTSKVVGLYDSADNTGANILEDSNQIDANLSNAYYNPSKSLYFTSNNMNPAFVLAWDILHLFSFQTPIFTAKK